MMKHEFEQLAGYEVSAIDYDEIIEPMYMATKLNKEEFIKTLNKKRFALPSKASVVKEMRKIAQHLAETCEYYTDYDASDKLTKMAHEYAKRFCGLDIENNIHAYCYFEREYTMKEIQRGCTYPKKLVIGYENKTHSKWSWHESIELVK